MRETRARERNLKTNLSLQCERLRFSRIPGLGRSPGERNGYPPQYCGLENSMDYTVHGDLKESDTTEH